MKRYTHYLSLSLDLLLLLVSGCDSHEALQGDSRIHEFALTDASGELVYAGVISGTDITISIPANVSPSSLKPRYILSERATIAPKPEEIVDWTSPVHFTVRSFSGSEAHYTVTIRASEVVVEENVFLRTDSEVEAFAAKGIDRIVGSLTIGAATGTDSIHTLAPLAHLKGVKYKLTINPTFKGSLEPLRDLTEVGSLIIHGTPADLHAIDFPELVALPGQLLSSSDSLRVVQLPKLQTSGFVNLSGSHLERVLLSEATRIDSLRISSQNLKQLSFDRLHSCGNISVSCPTRYNLPKDISIEMDRLSFPELKEAGRINFEKIETLVDLDLGALEHCENLILGTLPLLEQVSLPKLKSISLSGTFFIKYELTALTKVSAPLLECVGTIELRSGSSLRTIEFPALREMAGTYEIFYASGLTGRQDFSKIAGLHGINLQDIDKVEAFIFPAILPEIYIRFGREMTKLPEFIGLEECEKITLSEVNSPEIKRLAFPNLRRASSILDFNLNGHVREIILPDLVETGNLTLRSNDLTRVEMPKLTTVNGTLNLSGKTAREFVFDSLTSVKTLKIGGTWSGYTNEFITDLNMFARLTTLERAEIKWCPNLRDFSGLRKVVENGSLTEKGWQTYSIQGNGYNPTFADLKAGRYVAP